MRLTYVDHRPAARRAIEQLRFVEAQVAKSENNVAIVRQAEAFKNWCNLRSFQAFPIEIIPLAAYLVAKTEELGGSTKSLHGRISKLRTFCLTEGLSWLNPTDARRLEGIAKRMEFLDLRPTKRAKPATSPIILILTKNQDIHHILLTMIVTAHDGLLRGAELCSGIRVEDLDWNHDQSVTLHLHRSKCCRRGGGEYVHLVNYQPNCAADLLYKHFRRFRLWRYPQAYVFPQLRKNQIVPQHFMTVSWFRSAFRAALKKSGIEPHGFGTHSLRAGGATDLFKAGVSYPNIKKYGRWRSDAALIYYRDSDAVVDEVYKGFKRLNTFQ